ncbi:MAG: alpha/beta hydrolase-fold protein, partial [Vicinamibacteria bacterium]
MRRCWLWLLLLAARGEAQETRFEASFPATAHAEPLTGRVYVMISRTNETEPRLQISQTGGTPFFGRDVERLAPGEVAILDETDLGSPVPSLPRIPAGEYFVQALVNVYSEFRRSDGHVVWMHDDRWEGQKWNVSPGNLYSLVQKVRLDPERGYRVSLAADQVIPQIEIPPDSRLVKRFRFESPMLTKFWGRPIYLGATVLLPRDYETESISYPVVYHQGHFSLQPPLRFEEGGELHRDWIEDDFPRMIVVTFQHPNPYFDDSYAVNSANVGPYGDALMQELIPEVEKRYRVIREPWARALTGGSTGGWEALALQLFHPEFFGGTW